jgi:hypothetical protein
MSGLLRRLTRRRPATADETRSTTPESSEPAGAPTETPAASGGGRPVPAGDEQATQVLPTTDDQPAAPAEPARASDQRTMVGPEQTAAIPPPAPVRDLPAGIDPGELAGAPVASARRGKLRRRLRYLRGVRDLLLRDLGGFTYEIQRTAGGTIQEAHRRLIESKTNRIVALDTEVRGLEGRLAEPHGETLLREPGIGGTCPECGELHASDAHYCSRCGAPLDAKARARRDAAVAAAVQHTTSSHPTPEPAHASVLWAAGPRPERTTEPEAEEQSPPSPATSQWLALSHHRPAPKDDDSAQGGDAPEPSAAADAGSPAPKADGPAPPGDEPSAGGGDDPAPAGDPPSAPADQPATPGDEPSAASGDGLAAGDAPKRPRTSRAKKPRAAADDQAAEKPKRPRAKKPAPEFDAGPNGRRDDDVPPPVSSGDPLTSRPEQGS